MSINRVNITGNLTRDPELRATAGGTQVTGDVHSIDAHNSLLPLGAQAQSKTTVLLLVVATDDHDTISCSQCGYTELYKAQTSTGMNILDFLLNG